MTTTTTEANPVSSDYFIGTAVILVLAIIIGGVAFMTSHGRTYEDYKERGETQGAACAASVKTFEDVLSCADTCSIDDGSRMDHSVWTKACQTGFMKEISHREPQ